MSSADSSSQNTSGHDKVKSANHASLDCIAIVPSELWRVIFSYLDLRSICRSAQVCVEWRHLVASLDNTVWKLQFLASLEWKHPSWPLDEHEVVHRPWRHLYREHKLASRAWATKAHLPGSGPCVQLRRRSERKVIYVGPMKDHETLRSALNVACEYDKIIISPGVYDEQFEMSSKIPFELVGGGPLGAVVLVMSVEQNAATGRLCNLVLKAPWFTSHVIKVKQGHLQVDNCILQDGQVIAYSPATCHFRYCKFQKAQINLHHISMSIIENCLFTDYPGSAVCIEGYPSDELTWSHQHLGEMSDTWGIRNFGKELDEKDREYCPSPMSYFHSSSDLQSFSECSVGTEMAQDVPSARFSPPVQEDVDSIGVASLSSTSSSSDTFDTRSINSENGTEHYKTRGWTADATNEALAAVAAKSDTSSSRCSSPPADVSCYVGDKHHFLSSLWCENDQNVIESNLQTDFYSALHSDPALQEAVEGTRGCIIRKCKMMGCHGGVMVSQQGQTRIEENEFRDLQYGIRCLQNSKVALLGNSIHHCTTSGVFMRLAAHGLIAGNDIYCTNEAGIDVRKNADPLIQCNRIHHCKRSGLVVLGNGRGTIKSNDIYQNKEAGIYILYKGNPFVSGNRIVHGGAAGIAINEEGRGYIAENLISANRWGGIDIRRGSDPHITHNYICNGLADGVVIGNRGKGTIEANTIKCNMGCGVWVMGGQPLIQLNQIYNNNDTGVTFSHCHQQDEDLSSDGPDTDSAASEGSHYERTSFSETSVGATDCTPQARLSYNTIYHNNGCGVIGHCNESILINGNAIHSNCNTGVLVKQSLPVNIVSNSITCNSGVGLHITSQAKVKVEGNGIYDNSSHGIVVQGEAVICRNDIFSNKSHAVSCSQDADCQMEENRIHAPNDLAIDIQGSVQCRIHNNTFYGGEAQLWPEDVCSDLEIKDNVTLKHSDQSDPEKQEGRSYGWHLENPSARPHIEAPPKAEVRTPTQNVTKVTRVMIPAGAGCRQTSAICVII